RGLRRDRQPVPKQHRRGHRRVRHGRPEGHELAERPAGPPDHQVDEIGAVGQRLGVEGLTRGVDPLDRLGDGQPVVLADRGVGVERAERPPVHRELGRELGEHGA
ncbi:MAG: hypothetical protein ACK559_12735, partial [bacterium]